MSSDQEYDDWFNDTSKAENSGDLQNQAAKFDTRDAEVRDIRAAGDMGSAETKMCGQLYVKFLGADGVSVFVRSGSGTLVKALGGDDYVVLTAAHVFDFIQEDTPCAVTGGFFILQRSAKGEYLARFNFGEDCTKNFDSYDSAGEKIGCLGADLAAVKVTKTKGGDIPEPVELVVVDADALAGTQGVMSGYPESSIVTLTDDDKAAGKERLKPEGFSLFYKQGEIEHVVGTDFGNVIAYSMDCSPGQDGGAVTNAEGQVVAVYSKPETLDEQGDDFYMATVIGQEQVDWFNGLAW